MSSPASGVQPRGKGIQSIERLPGASLALRAVAGQSPVGDCYFRLTLLSRPLAYAQGVRRSKQSTGLFCRPSAAAAHPSRGVYNFVGVKK